MMRLAEEGRQRGWWQAYGLGYDTRLSHLQSMALSPDGTAGMSAAPRRSYQESPAAGP